MRPDDVLPRDELRWVTADEANAFLSAVYGWMCAGLAITAVTAWFIAASPTVLGTIAANRELFWGLLIVQLGIVVVLSAWVQQLAAPLAWLLFVLVSAVTGLTMAFVTQAFTGESVVTTFLVTAGMFGGLAIYGTITRRSLSELSQFLFMGLLGVVLASIVAVFWRTGAFQFVLSLIGVLVFSGLAAYDAQRLKVIALQTPGDRSTSNAIVGALALYLDFTNLFLFLLRFTGNRR
jgi:FtsH-binding integral membrane protein